MDLGKVMLATTEPLCGVRLGDIECHLYANHEGLHDGLYPLPNGEFMEVGWHPSYLGVNKQPWLGDLACDSDEGAIPCAVYGEAPTPWEAVKWSQS